jgi:hypothetical protein
MLSPRQRLEDATTHFPVSTFEQARALQEELQSWYFSTGATFNIEVEPPLKNELFQQTGSSNAGSPKGGLWVDGCPWTSSVDASDRPGVSALEEAAAAVKGKAAAASMFGPPSPGFGRSAADRSGPPPARAAAGGSRGVAAATAYRQANYGLAY